MEVDEEDVDDVDDEDDVDMVEVSDDDEAICCVGSIAASFAVLVDDDELANDVAPAPVLISLVIEYGSDAAAVPVAPVAAFTDLMTRSLSVL